MSVPNVSPDRKLMGRLGLGVFLPCRCYTFSGSLNLAEAVTSILLVCGRVGHVFGGGNGQMLSVFQDLTVRGSTGLPLHLNHSSILHGEKSLLKKRCVRMDFNEEMDENYKRIKNRLIKEKIKLWLPPYLKSNEKKNIKELKELADTYGGELSIPRESCLMYLEKLQTKGLTNFKERNKYLTTGEASLRVIVFYEVGEIILTIGIELTKTGYDLRVKISKEASVTVNRLKVLFRGKFLKDELPLKDQHIKHGLHVMGIVLKGNCEVFSKIQEIEQANSTVADIESLSKNGYLQGAEQYQRLFDLPIKQRKILIRGMKLHRMGRAAIKKGDFALALVLLLEAEGKFGQCDSSLLKIFDNCGVLNLDIVWCYLNMQSLVLLPDAEERLHACENVFKESYWTNLENINPFKDLSWTALILVMRLHLLQVAVLYHQNKTYKAGVILKQAEEELEGLEVDDGQLNHLIELGYGETEARLSLRACKGDVEKAISKMDKRRREMAKKVLELAMAETCSKKEDNSGRGSTSAQGESELYKSLISMGCSEEISKWVLEQRKFTNSGTQAGGSQNSGTDDPEYRAVVLKTIINIGFKPKKAKAALKKHGGNFDAAVMELFEKEFKLGFESYLELEDEDEDEEDDDDADENDNASGNENAAGCDNAVGYSNEDESRRPSSAELQRERPPPLFPERADNVQYGYIDTRVKLESTFLKKYKELLKK